MRKIDSTIRKILREISFIDDFDGVLTTLTQRVQRALNVEACHLFLLNPDGTEYILRAASGEGAIQVGNISLKLNQGLVGLVGARGELINLEDAYLHPRFFHHPHIKDAQYATFMGAPLKYQRRLLGVMTVLREESQCFDADEQALLMTLSTQLSGLIVALQAKKDCDTLGIRRQAGHGEVVFRGTPSAPGVVLGQAVVVYPPSDLDSVPNKPVQDVKQDIAAFHTAIEKTKQDMHRLHRGLHHLPEEERALFEAYQHILSSEDFIHAVEKNIRNGQWVQSALKKVVLDYVRQFESMDNPYLKERAADIRDLGRRVLSHLQMKERERPHYPSHTILVGQDVSPADIAEVPGDVLKGVVSMRGSGNSHVAILARALGVPTVMGINSLPWRQLEGKEIIIDGYYGQVYVSPSEGVYAQFSALAKEEEELEAELQQFRGEEAQTKDGRPIALHVNAGLGGDIQKALTVGANGIGLFRTEIPFMVRERFPSEDEQRAIYRQLLQAFAPRPVVMRTLDIGGDKVLPYFPIEEDNPFLGWRGIRVALDHPELFLAQIRAMLRASVELNNLHLMLPMITTIEELDSALRLVNQAYTEVSKEEAVVLPKIGAMVEVPSAVYHADAFAKRVDFLSVGSNDLIQYLLAVDRNNARVANLYSGFHPAVLHALQHVVNGAHRVDTPVGICGEMAGDPIAVMLLVAMGFDTLSMNATALPRIKWVIRHFSLSQAAALLDRVMTMEDATEVRCYMELNLVKAGLGGLVRAGRY